MSEHRWSWSPEVIELMAFRSQIRYWSWRQRASAYRLRIDDEVFRLNTVGPPPPLMARAKTSVLAESLGHLAGVAMCIPSALARRWSPE